MTDAALIARVLREVARCMIHNYVSDMCVAMEKRAEELERAAAPAPAPQAAQKGPGDIRCVLGPDGKMYAGEMKAGAIWPQIPDGHYINGQRQDGVTLTEGEAVAIHDAMVDIRAEAQSVLNRLTRARKLIGDVS